MSGIAAAAVTGLARPGTLDVHRDRQPALQSSHLDQDPRAAVGSPQMIVPKPKPARRGPSITPPTTRMIIPVAGIARRSDPGPLTVLLMASRQGMPMITTGP